jgi:hypothetical protein
MDPSDRGLPGSAQKDAPRRGVADSGTGFSATIIRVRSAALQKSGAPLRTHEHALAAALSRGLLGVSLLGLRFPRLLAWPLALVGTLFGGLGIVRAARSAKTEGSPSPRRKDADDPPQDRPAP